MKEPDKVEEQIWAYIHRQMPKKERKEFERSLQDDPELQRRVDTVREMSKRLKVLVPLRKESDEELEGRILRQWEKAQGEAPPVYAWKPARAWSLMPKLAWSAVTIAAMCLLFVGIGNYTLSPVSWEGVDLLGIEPRGDEGPQPFYAPQDLKGFSQILKEEIEVHIEASAAIEESSLFRRRDQWSLRAGIQELPDGALYVTVRVFEKDKRTQLKEWSISCPDAGAFERWLPDFGREIAEDLATINSSTEP